MIEDWAVTIAAMDESERATISLAVVYGGFLVGALAQSRSEAQLPRAPYFVCLSAIYAFWAIALYIPLLDTEAILHGRIWRAVFGMLLTALIGGGLAGAAASARARDAYDKAWPAFLALIPVLGLVLMFARSQNPGSPRQISTPAFASGLAGVVVGLALSLTGVGANALNEVIGRAHTAEAPGTEMTPADSVAAMIDARGLESTLTALAASASLPQRIDEVTELERIEVRGPRLVRTYRVTRTGFRVSETIRDRIVSGICAHAGLRRLIESGAAIHEVYRGPSGEFMGEHTVKRADCALETPRSALKAALSVTRH